MLDLRHNRISYIAANTFQGLLSLRYLYLDGNPLKHIHMYGLSGMSSITVLNLSDLCLETISSHAFDGLYNLEELIISGNNLSFMEESTLESLPLLKGLDVVNNTLDFQDLSFAHFPIWKNMLYIKADDWKFCCLAETTTYCQVSMDSVSCKNLLGSPVLKSLLFVISMTAIGENLFVLFHHISKGKLTKQNIILFNLAFSDSLYACYVFGIAVADEYFYGIYVLKDYYWRNGLICKILGVLCNLSVCMSLFCLTFLALLRYLTFRRKGNNKVLSSVKIGICFCAFWVFLLLHSTSLFFYSGIEFGTCSLYSFKFSSNSISDYLFLFNHVILNTIMIAIFTVYTLNLIFILVSRNQEMLNAGRRFGGVSTTRSIFLLLAQLVVTLICWVPVQIILFSSLFGVKISFVFVNWITLFVFSFCSVTNPFFYTLRGFAMSFKIPFKR